VSVVVGGGGACVSVGGGGAVSVFAFGLGVGLSVGGAVLVVSLASRGGGCSLSGGRVEGGGTIVRCGCGGRRISDGVEYGCC
jgi:hypothetical protein